MKPVHLSWHEYLNGYAGLQWRRPGDEQRFHKILGSLQPLYAVRGADLLHTPGPKQVVAFATNSYARRDGHPPYCFRVQCLTTGRMSRYVEYERYIEFGILTEDTQTGGPFPREPLKVTDRIAPIIATLQAQLSAIRPVWDDPTVVPWYERYGEYLQSEEWFLIREQILRRDGYRCTITGKATAPGDPLQVHHLTYDRVGCERPEDLVTVCRSQHEKIHGRRFDQD